jgi:hypothetical protein
MENQNIHDIERRLAALESAVASLTEKNKGEHSDEPCGQFASIGGIERLVAGSFKPSDEPIDFSSIGGQYVHAPEEKGDEAHAD